MANGIAELRMEIAGEIAAHEAEIQVLRRILTRLEGIDESATTPAAQSAATTLPVGLRRDVRGAILAFLENGRKADFGVISSHLTYTIGTVQEHALKRSLETLARDQKVAMRGSQYMIPRVAAEIDAQQGLPTYEVEYRPINVAAAAED